MTISTIIFKMLKRKFTVITFRTINNTLHSYINVKQVYLTPNKNYNFEI